MQTGFDAAVLETANGGALVGGVTAHYGEASAEVASVFGAGEIDSKGYGLGATLTWYGAQGFYTDGQAQFSWYDFDLRSNLLGDLKRGADGKGETYSIETGKRMAVSDTVTVTPQVQVSYSNVDFDTFVDPAGAVVSADKGDSLKTRVGVSLDLRGSTRNGDGQTHIYSVANVSYEWLDGVRTVVSGTTLADHAEPLWGELGLGGSYSWSGGRFSIYSEVSANTAFSDFGDSYILKGAAGFRAKF